MSVPVLSCPCGLRMKAKGATPGRVGKCPKCGRSITVPEAVEVEAVPPKPVAAVPEGYATQPTFHAAVADPEAIRPPGSKKRKKVGQRPTDPPRPLEVARELEPWWRPDVGFPARGAEGLVTVGMVGLALWVVTVVTPELGLAFVSDASKLGATALGILFAIVASLPALILGPFVFSYALQYLGRSLVSGAMGEVVPPRPPDRNFEGLFAGLAPWMIWLALGASVGLGPLAISQVAMGGEGTSNPIVVGLLAAVGLPYALTALMMAFLVDGGIPRPGGVVGAMARFPFAIGAIGAIEFGLGLVVVGAFTLALRLREEAYWVYFPLMIPCWMLALWAGMVGMRVLGVFYHQHASILRWHRDRPWWGVTWGM